MIRCASNRSRAARRVIEPKVEALIKATGIDFRIGGERAFYVPVHDYVRRLTERVIAPPLLVSGTTGTVPSDDWSLLPPPPMVGKAEAALKTPAPAPPDPANAGIRREVDLPSHEEIAPVPKKPAQEFTFTAEKSDDEAARDELLRLQDRGLARQVELDPKDGSDL
jgi:type IV secretion system protein VirD4